MAFVRNLETPPTCRGWLRRTNEGENALVASDSSLMCSDAGMRLEVDVGIHATQPSRAFFGAPLSCLDAKASRGLCGSSCKHVDCSSRIMSYPRRASWLGALLPIPHFDEEAEERRDIHGVASSRDEASSVSPEVTVGGSSIQCMGSFRMERDPRVGDPNPFPLDVTSNRTAPLARVHGPCSEEPRHDCEPLPSAFPRRVGPGRLQPTFFRFSKTCTRLVPLSLPDPLVEVG